MFCDNCGKEIPDDAKFCPECGVMVSNEMADEFLTDAWDSGTPDETAEPVQELAVSKEKKVRKKKETYAKDGKVTGDKVTENIYLCPDGVYRWFYQMDMLKNPTILFTVWKVLGIAFGVVALFIFIVDLFQGVITNVSDLLPAMKVILILIPVFFVISIISYLILAATFGWKYFVLFEMTDEYVKHIPSPKQFKKAQALNWLTVMVGAMAHNPTVMGSGMLAGAKAASTSEFKNVEFIRVRRKFHTIHVDQLLDKNQVYCEDADFDFVEKFIKERCVKAKIR
ncbi:MAG: zinc ribbon domain-containing protein [Flexilinea sp.]|nr:zinc ribbon domain-containing protein [Flexilinea sp.]